MWMDCSYLIPPFALGRPTLATNLLPNTLISFSNVTSLLSSPFDYKRRETCVLNKVDTFCTTNLQTCSPCRGLCKNSFMSVPGWHCVRNYGLIVDFLFSFGCRCGTVGWHYCCRIDWISDCSGRHCAFWVCTSRGMAIGLMDCWLDSSCGCRLGSLVFGFTLTIVPSVGCLVLRLAMVDYLSGFSSRGLIGWDCGVMAWFSQCPPNLLFAGMGFLATISTSSMDSLFMPVCVSSWDSIIVLLL